MTDDKKVYKDKYYRFRVSIPKSATQLLEWLDNQENVSYSVVHILREWIAQNGTDSVFARPIDPIVKRGRPKGSVTQAYSEAQDEADAAMSQRHSVDDMNDGFADPDDLFARQAQNRKSGQSIADLLNNR